MNDEERIYITTLGDAFLARMPVPKMVKNGFDSSFVIWGQF